MMNTKTNGDIQGVGKHNNIFDVIIKRCRCKIDELCDFGVISFKDVWGALFLELHGRFVSHDESSEIIASIRKMKRVPVCIYEYDVMIRHYNASIYDCYITRCEGIDFTTGQIEFRINVVCTIIEKYI